MIGQTIKAPRETLWISVSREGDVSAGVVVEEEEGWEGVDVAIVFYMCWNSLHRLNGLELAAGIVLSGNHCLRCDLRPLVVQVHDIDNKFPPKPPKFPRRILWV